MPFIVHAVTSYPEYVVEQSEVKNFLKKVWPNHSSYIEQFSDNTSVSSRQFSLPMNHYADLEDMGKRNAIWKSVAVNLQKENIKKILDITKIDIADIGLIASATSTGVTVPSLEALMMNQFPFSANTIRLPLFGLGCLAGVAGMNRVNDFLIGHPRKAALFLVTELCSLTFQQEDQSVANIIGSSLFGDGSGAVLMVGNNHPLAQNASFEILSTESIFYPNTEQLMGWQVVKNGFQLLLSGGIPNLVREYVGHNIDEFLNKNNLLRNDISYFIAHPGGPKVLDALSLTLNLGFDKLHMSWESLKKYGNTSSTSVINVLEQTIILGDIAPHVTGLMMAMGPAFSLELSLVRKC
jgi:alkylresorcinol/alkylpyrone synthase